MFCSYHNHSAVHYNLHCRLWTRTRTLCHFWMLIFFVFFSIYFLCILHFRIECLRKRNSQIWIPQKSPDFICGIGSGNGLAKAESIFHKILDRSKKNVVGNNLWSRSTKFENIVEFVTFILWNPTIFLGPTNFLWNRILCRAPDGRAGIQTVK